MRGFQAAALLALTLVQACGDADEPLPPVYGKAWDQDCLAPPPAPPPPAGLELGVITHGQDPAHCLPSDVRRKGLLVDVELSPAGRPVRAAAAQHMCVVIGPDGNVQPQFTLTPAAEECILEDLRSWRFARGSPCRPHGTTIRLSEDHGQRSGMAALQVSGGCGS